MKFRNREYLHILGFLFLCVIFYFIVMQKRLVSKEVDVYENSIFVYRAYLDKRGTSPTLRVLAFNKCHNDSVLHVHMDRKWVPLKPTPMVLRCPEWWASGCILVAYFHELVVGEKFSANDLLLKGPNATEIIPLHVAEPAKELGITMCIAPMFWYTDWTKLIFFLEYWKKQQVETINIYVHSTSAAVRKVLDFYEQKGWITIIPWPMMPSSATFEPSGNIYRLGQIFSHNDCFLRTTTEFTLLVDIDEILYTPKQPLTDYVLSNFKDKNLGALIFPHHAAVFQSPLLPKPFLYENVDYSGIHKIQYKFDRNRQPKLIARTDTVYAMAVHNVNAFRKNQTNKNVPAADGKLFHIRYDVDLADPENITSIVGDPNYFQLNLMTKTQNIFPEGASFNEETQIVLGKCTDSWRETQNNCKAPATFCRSAVIDKEEWVEEKENVYAVL